MAIKCMIIAAVIAPAIAWTPGILGATPAFPVEPSRGAGPTYTYLSVNDPEAVNLDGSRYGIAVCINKASNASWQFSTDGGGWCCE